MASVIDGESGRQRRPVVSVEDAAAEERNEPWPVCAAIVVRGDVEADPAAAVGHVLLECSALLWSVGKIVQPEDQLIAGESVCVEVVPVVS
jgi:hypothetical protein